MSPFRLVFAAALALACVAASAQRYPSKPVRLVVPFTPGGSTDIVAGIITQKLVEFWGQQFVIDNRPGAGGAIGAETVARAAPEKFGAFMRSEAERLKPLVVAGTLQIE